VLAADANGRGCSAGQAKFGPDVEWVDALDYSVDPKRAETFYAAIRTYWPDPPDNSP
jgi:L-2-hydroxyglutarate oxidase LhgO